MNGAESLIRSLLSHDVEICFTNPGTSEMHIVAALDRVSEMRCVLGLFEGVVTAAADGYGRMAEKPACTLLHLGPGLANGLANLHNARRAYTPIVNIIGQHASQHLRYDAPLTTDIEAIARPYSGWVRTAAAVSEISRDAADAVAAAGSVPGRIATLIVPADVAWTEGATLNEPTVRPRPPMPTQQSVERALAVLRSGERTALLMAGNSLYGKGLASAGRIAKSTGAKLLAPYNFSRIERGAGRPPIDRMPYILEQAIETLKEFRQLILVGAPAPVSYFAYPGKNSVPTSPECQFHALATPSEDSAGALEMLEAALSIRGAQSLAQTAETPPLPSGDITLPGLAATVAALLPENVIVVDESMTSGHGMMAASRGSAPHDWLANTGGSIGIALPLAVGAAVACPTRRVLCLSADGSGMFTAQALWSMAREKLDVTTVIFANRTYGVLKREFSNLGVGKPGVRALNLFEIGRPDLDWVSLAKGMGVPGRRVTSLEAFGEALQEGLRGTGPTLIEVPL